MSGCRPLALSIVSLLLLSASPSVHAAFELVTQGQPRADIVTDTGQTQGKNGQIIQAAGQWLGESVQRATGAQLEVLDQAGDRAAVVLALAAQHPDIAKQAGLEPGQPDAFAIVTAPPQRVYVLGNSAVGVRHGVATLLHELGFRWYAPSPRWWVTPETQRLAVDLNTVQTPALRGRKIWYAYGTGGDKPMQANYLRWANANRLGSAAPFHTGHSYGHIIRRNKEVFDQHPEYFAMLENGQRDTHSGLNARKFCYSNPGLIELVSADRIKLLEERRKANPHEFMVSVDPSDGRGTCHCDDCVALGTTTDRVIHLANEVAKALRQKHPDAWVGLYVYSSHRTPPTIEVEPNVYVQVAMGFNRTQYTLPELVSAWAQKVNAIGLREYYGVEAWDWGMPGRMRGAQVDYHRKWIPYYAKRKLNALNAETNANWGGQTLGLYVASQLIWDPSADVDAMVDEYFERSFGSAAEPMRALQAKFDLGPPLQPTTLRPMFDDLTHAFDTAGNAPSVRARIVDMMAYMHYLMLFRDLMIAESQSPERGDVYYDALGPLMEFAWRIRDRDVVHYYALARRLCNGLPLVDHRFEYWMALGEKPIREKHLTESGVDPADLPDRPIWKTGGTYTDQQIIELFRQDRKRLEHDDDPTVFYTRYFDFCATPGEDAGSSKAADIDVPGAAQFRDGVTAYFGPPNQATYALEVKAIDKPVTVTAYRRGKDVMSKQIIKPSPDLQTVEIKLPKAGEYRVTIDGDAVVRTAPEVPMMYEASPALPAKLVDSGPLYFYVPRGAEELVFNTDGRVTLKIPGKSEPVTYTAKDREPGKDYIVVPLDEQTAGRVWHVTSDSAGPFKLINVPPLLTPHRHVLLIPRGVSMADALTTGGRSDDP